MRRDADGLGVVLSVEMFEFGEVLELGDDDFVCFLDLVGVVGSVSGLELDVSRLQRGDVAEEVGDESFHSFRVLVDRLLLLLLLFHWLWMNLLVVVVVVELGFFQPTWLHT